MIKEITIMGNTISLYTVFDTLAGLTLLLYILFQTKKYRDIMPYKKPDRKIKTLLSFVQLFAISMACYSLFLVFNRRFADWFTEGNANYFGNLTAWLLVLLVVPTVFRVSPLKTMDLLSPGLPLCLFAAKLACVCNGCCSGFEMQHSFYYNQYTQRYEFPVQILEALTALGLFFVIKYYRDKKNKIPGSVFPCYLVLYSTSRFITEFFRADLPKVLKPFDAYQILSAIFVIIGAALYFFVKAYKNKKEQRKQDAAS